MRLPDVQPSPLALLKRYAIARAGQFRRSDFLTWAAHHGLARETDPAVIDDAFISAVADRSIELVSGQAAQLHPLYRSYPAKIGGLIGGVIGFYFGGPDSWGYWI